MKTTVTIEKAVVEELVRETKARSQSEAVGIAAREEIKRRKRQRLLHLAGRIDFDSEAETLRHGDSRLGR
jgi:Arc/MetJ family transcription regulator